MKTLSVGRMQSKGYDISAGYLHTGTLDNKTEAKQPTEVPILNWDQTILHGTWQMDAARNTDLKRPKGI